MDVDDLGQQPFRKNEVFRVLQVLNEAGIKYAVWGSAAVVYHGGRWLWKCLDYEIVIDDWFDGPRIRRAVDTITTRCSTSWKFDHEFDIAVWARSRGDRPPNRPYRRFGHLSDYSRFGIILVPLVSAYVKSTYPVDFVRDEHEPLWIYPSLRNLVESQLMMWSHGGCNTALMDLADLASARRLSQRWADEVGLEVSRLRGCGREHLPSEWDMWEEIVRMVLTQPDPERATARFAARQESTMALETS